MQFHSTGSPEPAEGGLASVDVEGQKVALARVDGQVYAFEDTCTHAQCSLSEGELEGRRVICPCHMGTFDVTSGTVLEGPPPAPLRTWPARVVDGTVELAR